MSSSLNPTLTPAWHHSVPSLSPPAPHHQFISQSRVCTSLAWLGNYLFTKRTTEKSYRGPPSFAFGMMLLSSHVYSNIYSDYRNIRNKQRSVPDPGHSFTWVYSSVSLLCHLETNSYSLFLCCANLRGGGALWGGADTTDCSFKNTRFSLPFIEVEVIVSFCHFY